MSNKPRYYASLDRNGTEDEILIHAPDGRAMSFIWFWDDPDCPYAKRHKADGKLIVRALNAYRPGEDIPVTRKRRYHFTTGHQSYWESQVAVEGEKQIAICTPCGRHMALIWFLDEPGSAETAQAKADAELIVNALNAYRPRKPRTNAMGGKKARSRWLGEATAAGQEGE
jgi:hypothetical protein